MLGCHRPTLLLTEKTTVESDSSDIAECTANCYSCSGLITPCTGVAGWAHTLGGLCKHSLLGAASLQQYKTVV